METNKKELFICGTRPDIIKLAPLIKKMDSFVIHTGQHAELANDMFELFDIKPDVNLELMTKNQTLDGFLSKSIFALSKVVKENDFKRIWVHGDTSSALAGALVATTNQIQLVHNEAGLRSHDKKNPFPEETFRTIIDSMSDILFAPTKRAVDNLKNENVQGKIYLVGNTVIDSLKMIEKELSSIRPIKEKYVLATVHRRESFGDDLFEIFSALKELSKEIKVILPAHPNPNVQMMIKKVGLKTVKPMNYLNFLWYLKNCEYVISDCLHKDTLINTKNGIKKISEITIKDKVLQIDSNNNKVYSNPISVSKKKHKEGILLKIKGNYIKCSNNHKIFTSEGFKKAKDIEIGDFVSFCDSVPSGGNNNIKLISKHIIPKYVKINKDGINLIRKENKKMCGSEVSSKWMKEVKLTKSFIGSVLSGKKNISEFEFKKILKELKIEYSLFFSKYCEYSKISCRRQMKLPEVLTPDLAFFIGDYIGDGSVPVAGQRLCITDKEKSTLEYNRDIVKRIFGYDVIIKKSENRFRLFVSSKDITNFFLTNFPEMNLYQQQRVVPSKILKADNNIIANFLKGIFTAEGHCDCLRVGFGSSSNMLTRQIQQLLLRFGVVSSICQHKDKRNEKWSPMTNLQITDRDSISNFSKFINFQSVAKKRNLEKLIIAKSKKRIQHNFKTKDDLFFGRVTKKEIFSFKEDLYDLAFSKNNNFFADGILVHNSGGLQEEGVSFNKKVIVLRKETERQEIIELGYGILIKNMKKNYILKEIKKFTNKKIKFGANPYGSGNSSDKIIKIIEKTK